MYVYTVTPPTVCIRSVPDKIYEWCGVEVGLCDFYLEQGASSTAVLILTVFLVIIIVFWQTYSLNSVNILIY